MDEQFETTSLIKPSELVPLKAREDLPSIIRFSLHAGCFVILAALITFNSETVLIALPCTLLMAGVWAGFFAPFHECIHHTAFQTPKFNYVCALISGVLFISTPTAYKSYHFQHHRFTQDPEHDPEISPEPELRTQWPLSISAWFSMLYQKCFLQEKIQYVVLFALTPLSQWSEKIPYIPEDQQSKILTEARIIFTFWLLLIAAFIFGALGAGWILLAGLLSHFFIAVWLSAEHTGLPCEGSIFNRARTVNTNRIVRFFIWNMNYHAEHHAWPFIPWHKLPTVHNMITEHLEHQETGYLSVHYNVIKQMPQ
ncbi:MAG: fatty acid desaturase [Gammaproteobacteria bacterium]